MPSILTAGAGMQSATEGVYADGDVEKKPTIRLLSTLRLLKFALVIPLIATVLAARELQSRAAYISALCVCGLFLAISFSITLIEWKEQRWRRSLGTALMITTTAALLFGYLAATGVFR